MDSFNLFGLTVHWYGLIIALGMVAGILLASYNARKRGLSSDDVVSMALIVIPLAIVGARALFVLSNLELYASFWEMVATWNGGLSIIGGVMGGAIGVTIFSVWKKVHFFNLADIAVPSLILGQAIGRWGNYFNQEVYGMLVENPAWQWFPFAVNISGQWFHALFFYESVLNLLGVGLLLLVLYKAKPKGLVLAGYLFYYGLVRTVLESLRQPEFIMRVFGLPISQVLSALMCLGGAGLFAWIMITQSNQARQGELASHAPPANQSK